MFRSNRLTTAITKCAQDLLIRISLYSNKKYISIGDTEPEWPKVYDKFDIPGGVYQPYRYLFEGNILHLACRKIQVFGTIITGEISYALHNTIPILSFVFQNKTGKILVQECTFCADISLGGSFTLEDMKDIPEPVDGIYYVPEEGALTKSARK